MTETTTRAGLTRFVRGALFVFSMVCLGWVLWPVLREANELGETLEGWSRLALAVVVGAVAYAVLTILMASAWWWLSGIYGSRPPAAAGYAIWARSQLAKYLPGNALHYVTRQMLGREAGLSHPALVASGILEMGSLLLAAFVVGAAGLSAAQLQVWGGLELPPWTPWVIAAAGLAGLFAWPVCDRLLRRLSFSAGWMQALPPASARQTLRLLMPAVALHALFFLGTGLILWGLVSAAGGATESPASVLGLYPIAWMAGTVTLGAPGGVGVREALLTLGLEPMLDPARAALVALALRLVTLGGDLLTALVGWWVGGRAE